MQRLKPVCNKRSINWKTWKKKRSKHKATCKVRWSPKNWVFKMIRGWDLSFTRSSMIYLRYFKRAEVKPVWKWSICECFWVKNYKKGKDVLLFETNCAVHLKHQNPKKKQLKNLISDASLQAKISGGAARWATTRLLADSSLITKSRPLQCLSFKRF